MTQQRLDERPFRARYLWWRYRGRSRLGAVYLALPWEWIFVGAAVAGVALVAWVTWRAGR